MADAQGVRPKKLDIGKPTEVTRRSRSNAFARLPGGRARAIAAQTFASKVVARVDPHARVQAEAVALDRERRRLVRALFERSLVE